MARRKNLKTIKGDEEEAYNFSLPTKINKPIDGINPDGMALINALLLSNRFGLHAFKPLTPHHEDWMILFVIMANESLGRATVTKNIVELTGRAYGTVRASLQRFVSLGYIESNQRIGRSELYVPTPALKQIINQSAEDYWSNLTAIKTER